MNGHIWLESEVGQGSTFHFTARFGFAAEAPAKAARGEMEILHGLPVLVVDDNATNRRILEEILTNWRMKPTLADSAPAALTALRIARRSARPFRLALIDAQMPAMDGFTLARRIQQDRSLSGTAIIMLTSAGWRDGARCRQAGVSACLTKPVKQSDLFDTIVTTLGREGKLLRHGRRFVAVHGRSGARRGAAGRHLHILMAEDKLVNQKLAVHMLQKRGHKVAVVANGREALAVLEKSGWSRFDLALMDVQMPVMGGFEATAAIREKEKSTGRHLPIIALTADAMKGDRERCLQAGMDDYLSKPIRQEELFAKIESLAADGSAGPAIDQTALLGRLGSDRKLLRELIRIFLADCPKMLARIRKAISTRDAAALQSAAHALKGSIANFEAKDALHAALKLEEMGREKDLSQAENAYAVLKEELSRSRSELVGLAGTKARTKVRRRKS